MGNWTHNLLAHETMFQPLSSPAGVRCSLWHCGLALPVLRCVMRPHSRSSSVSAGFGSTFLGDHSHCLFPLLRPIPFPEHPTVYDCLSLLSVWAASAGGHEPSCSLFIPRGRDLFNFRGGCCTCSKEVVWCCVITKRVRDLQTLPPADTGRCHPGRLQSSQGCVVEPHCGFSGDQGGEHLCAYLSVASLVVRCSSYPSRRQVFAVRFFVHVSCVKFPGLSQVAEFYNLHRGIVTTCISPTAEAIIRFFSFILIMCGLILIF